MQFTKEPHIPENAYLKIDLAGPVIDSDTSALSRKESVRNLWYHLKRAKVDKRIKGIFLKISWLNTGYAKVEDIGRLIENFKTSGKKVYAFIEGAGLKGYYLSTFADKTYVFKGGELFLKGLASEAMFLKNTLSQLGIKADLYHIGEYKTAGNMFTEDRMTPAHKESLEKLLNDIYITVLEGIAANRGIDADTVRKIIDETPVSNKIYQEGKLIDGILYEDEVLKELGGGEDPILVSLGIYKQTRKPLPYVGSKKVAVIFAAGEIHRGKSGGKSLFGSEILGSDTVARQLKSARKSTHVKAVVLRIDSPGGSAMASDVIRREAELVVKEKPLVISMSDLAASGGYWMSMSSSKIMALPQTITGSIGVVAGKFVLKGLYDKVGINKETVKTSKYAAMFSDYREFSPAEKEKMMSIMKHIYQSFLEIVAKDRKMKKEDVDKIARGRVWAGTTANKLKLVDRMGGLDEAIKEAKKLAKIPDDESIGIRVYPRKRSMLDMIFELLSSKSDYPTPLSLETKIQMYKRFFPALIMPFQISIL
jgi:protease-4